MKIIITAVILFSSTLSFANQWECTGFANAHFVQTSQNKGGFVKSTYNPSTKSINPLRATIQKLDEAFDKTSGVENICKVATILDQKFPSKNKKIWPTHYAWIFHWKKTSDRPLTPATNYYENISLQNFNDIYNNIANEEAFYDFSTNEKIVGCYYECTMK